jgi:hypothetical protein
MEIAFWLANLAVIPFWVLMIFTPRWSVTQRIIASYWIMLPVLLVSLIWGFTVVSLHPPEGGFFGLIANFASPHGIANLSTVPDQAIVTWIHLLVFDLFAGRWIYLDSQERQYKAWWVSPLLVITVSAAPLGFLIYLMVRAGLNRRTLNLAQAY